MKVKIISDKGCGYGAWYDNQIGQTFDVIENKDSVYLDPSCWKYLAKNEDGKYNNGIAETDCEIIKEEKFLEDAYDPPECLQDNLQEYTYAQALSNTEVETSVLTKKEQAYYKAPETRKKIYVKKRSAEAIVADSFNQHNGTNLTEVDVERIIAAVNAIKSLEK